MTLMGSVLKPSNNGGNGNNNNSILKDSSSTGSTRTTPSFSSSTTETSKSTTSSTETSKQTTSTNDGCWVTRMILTNLITLATWSAIIICRLISDSALLKRILYLLPISRLVCILYIPKMRSRRKAPDGKENVVGAGGGVVGDKSFKGDKGGGSWDERCGRRGSGSGAGPRLSPSGDFSICDIISDHKFRELVKVPVGLDSKEWLATHTVGFFHHVNALYGALAEFCTSDTCPVMNTPGNSQCSWVDERGKKWKYNAPQYVDSVMTATQKIVDSQDSFPTKYGNGFPGTFDSLVRKTVRLLWNVLGHMSCVHWEELGQLGLRPQLAAVMAHLSAFVQEFSLFEPKDAAALSDFVRKISRPLQPNNPYYCNINNNASSSAASDAIDSSATASASSTTSSSFQPHQQTSSNPSTNIDQPIPGSATASPVDTSGTTVIRLSEAPGGLAGGAAPSDTRVDSILPSEKEALICDHGRRGSSSAAGGGPGLVRDNDHRSSDRSSASSSSSAEEDNDIGGDGDGGPLTSTNNSSKTKKDQSSGGSWSSTGGGGPPENFGQACAQTA